MKFVPLLLALTALTATPAWAATLLVDTNVQWPSFSVDSDGDGILDAGEVTANDKCDNATECGVAAASCTSPDGLPDGNHDCLCNLSEAILAANSDSPVDSCFPDSDGSPLFGTEVIELEEDGPYDFKVLDNFGDNSGDFQNGPNALPKVKSAVLINGQGNTLRRISPLTSAECKALSPSGAFCFCSDVGGETQCEVFFRLFETSNFLALHDMTVTNFNPGCFEVPNSQLPVGPECFSGGFLYVEGGFADLDQVSALGNQTNIEIPKGQSGGAIFIEGDECLEEVEADVTIHESMIAGNSSLAGGGIDSEDSVLLTIDESTIRDNRAVELAECDKFFGIDEGDPACDCDGICEPEDNNENGTCGDCVFVSAEGTGEGGGIRTRNNQLTIFESSIHNNTADVFGGGLHVQTEASDDDDCDEDKMNSQIPSGLVINTTIGRNKSFVGGGMAYFSFPFPSIGFDPSFDVFSSTIAQNEADQLGGGVLKVISSAAMTFRNDIVADNTAFDGADCHGLITSEGHNHVGDSSGCIMSPISGDLFDLPAGLNAWVDDDPTDISTAGNGHFPLLPVSLNIDSADGTGCPSIDQIQVNRDEDLDFLMEFGECSKGAIEYDDVCGDGRLEPNNGEECDDGNLTDGDGCTAACLVEIPPVPTEPEGAICGNGTVEGGEECDDGESGNDDELPNACRTNCTNPSCGDEVTDTEFGEECDGDPTCLVGCTLDAIAGCNITMVDAVTLSYKDILDKYGFNAIVLCSQIGGGGANGLEKVSFESLQSRGINAGCTLIRE